MSGGPGNDDAATPIVACRDVTVNYGRVLALEGVDLAVSAGESVALLGPSGAGKTTLLHVVAGFVAPSAGTVDVSGQRVAGRATFVPAERRRVGMVFQHYALWPHLTALQTVAYPLRRGGVAPGRAQEQAQQLLASLDVAELAGRRPAEMSGGQQQRVGVAR